MAFLCCELEKLLRLTKSSLKKLFESHRTSGWCADYRRGKIYFGREVWEFGRRARKRRAFGSQKRTNRCRFANEKQSSAAFRLRRSSRRVENGDGFGFAMRAEISSAGNDAACRQIGFVSKEIISGQEFLVFFFSVIISLHYINSDVMSNLEKPEDSTFS